MAASAPPSFLQRSRLAKACVTSISPLVGEMAGRPGGAVPPALNNAALKSQGRHRRDEAF
ncbi:MAG: hypothetical protein EOR60_30405 [Mesorhizobium sp.]|nr:MAG: hypothetical protein EOR60_30405 [Mesorhizobium sp.]